MVTMRECDQRAGDQREGSMHAISVKAISVEVVSMKKPGFLSPAASGVSVLLVDRRKDFAPVTSVMRQSSVKDDGNLY